MKEAKMAKDTDTNNAAMAESVLVLDEGERYSDRVAEALDLMQGFMSSPVGSSSERDDKLRRVWQAAPLEDVPVTRVR